MAEEEKNPKKKAAPEAPKKEPDKVDQGIDALIKKISESNENKTSSKAVADEMAKRQVELLEEIYRVIAEQNDRQIDMLAELSEQRKADERMGNKRRINELEDKPRRGNESPLGRREGIFGGLATTGALLGGLGLAFIAFSTSLAAFKDQTNKFLQNADQAIQGLMASMWGIWKTFQGIVTALAHGLGKLVYWGLTVIDKAQDLIKMIPVIGEPLLKVVRLIGSAISGFFSGMKGVLDTLLWPLRQIAGVLRAFGRFSGILSVVIIAFDGFASAIAEYKKSGDIFKTTIAFLGGAINSVLTTIKGVWGVLKGLGGWISRMTGTEKAFQGFVYVIESTFGMIANGINAVIEAIKNFSFSGLIASAGKLITDSIDVVALAITTTVENMIGAFMMNVVAPFMSIVDAVMEPVRAAMSGIGGVGQSMTEGFVALIELVGKALDMVKNMAEGLKEQILSIPVPGFGNLGNALKSGGIVLDTGGQMVKGLITGNAEPPEIKPKENYAGKLLQQAKDKARSANMTMVVAPQTVDNSTVANTSMSSKVIAPMTTVNTRDPAFAF